MSKRLDNLQLNPGLPLASLANEVDQSTPLDRKGDAMRRATSDNDDAATKLAIKLTAETCEVGQWYEAAKFNDTRLRKFKGIVEGASPKPHDISYEDWAQVEYLDDSPIDSRLVKVSSWNAWVGNPIDPQSNDVVDVARRIIRLIRRNNRRAKQLKGSHAKPTTAYTVASLDLRDLCESVVKSERLRTAEATAEISKLERANTKLQHRVDEVSGQSNALLAQLRLRIKEIDEQKERIKELEHLLECAATPTTRTSQSETPAMLSEAEQLACYQFLASLGALGSNNPAIKLLTQLVHKARQ